MILLDFQQVYAHVTFTLSLLTNSLLLTLLITRKNKNLGGYKHLMFAFSLFGTFFSIVDFLNQPMVHVFGGAYLVFSVNSLNLPHLLAKLLNTLNCACYGMTISLLAVHFIYRYLAVCRPNKMNWFMSPNCTIWVFFCCEVFFEWWFSAILCANENDQIDELVRDSMQSNYNLTKGKFIYAASLYYKIDGNGNKTISWFDIIFAANIVKLITICIGIVIFCGIATFRKLNALQYTSKRTISLQKQLFKALVAQTLIPMVTMFLPAAVMMFSPIFEVTLGPYESLIMTVITTYPFLDPLVVIFFVKDYRNVIWQTIRCKSCQCCNETNSIRVTAVSFATEVQ